MEKISQDFYDILTQVTFKVKARFHVFFFFFQTQNKKYAKGLG